MKRSPKRHLATHWFQDIIHYEVGGKGGGGWILFFQPRHGVSVKGSIFVHIQRAKAEKEGRGGEERGIEHSPWLALQWLAVCELTVWADTVGTVGKRCNGCDWKGEEKPR